MSATATPTTFTFRERPARSDYSPVCKEVLNALVESTSILLVGTMDDDAYAAFVEEFGTDEGTTVLRYSFAPSSMRGAIERKAKSLKRKPKFAPLELHNGEEFILTAYRVSETR